MFLLTMHLSIIPFTCDPQPYQLFTKFLNFLFTDIFHLQSSLLVTMTTLQPIISCLQWGSYWRWQIKTLKKGQGLSRLGLWNSRLILGNLMNKTLALVKNFRWEFCTFIILQHLTSGNMILFQCFNHKHQLMNEVTWSTTGLFLTSSYTFSLLFLPWQQHDNIITTAFITKWYEIITCYFRIWHKISVLDRFVLWLTASWLHIDYSHKGQSRISEMKWWNRTLE